ncbi:BREX system P-loop protein BrxC [bacterium]|nr:BREX system P-loop protein BrxC [bacterium]
MDKIKDILVLDLAEDIKDVIDLEDRSDEGLQYEIENYIVTNTIAKYLDHFIALYQSNIKETGVWLSGFYGSGKSYFGKMLGYLLENRMVKGTQFQDRFIQRLAGVSNQSLLENAIRRLTVFGTKVVFLDIAKQNTKNGLSWTLFRNFLRTLGFLDDVFGYMEYCEFLKGGYSQFLADVERIECRNWYDLRKNPIQVPQIVRRVLTDTRYTPEEYNETKAYLDDRITSYDAAKFGEELSHYLEKHPTERIVFVIDEVSEAVGQKKIDLLELEGVSEALSQIPNGKVWTIAIAQEKLDDVIHNANLTFNELNKVTDRFKTKIHLSSEEVDTVIRKRMLLKKAEAIGKLSQFYSANNGLIIDTTSLNAKFPTKTENQEDFVTYYPFHKYHFDLLQNFLFSVHQKAKTGGTERGMIIATHIVLKNTKEKELFAFVTADNLVDGGKKVVDGELERKFARADGILKEKGSSIEGQRLLKTIYFLNESASIPASSESITKLYLIDPGQYYATKPDIEEALFALCEANLLLEKNNVYKIASDLEQRLIDEMKKITVEFHQKKRNFIEFLKKQGFIPDISKCTFEGTPYNFSLISDQGEELIYSPNKHIKIQVIAPFTVELENRDGFIEKKKFETQANTDTATLIPSMADFLEVNKLIEEVYRYGQLEDRYRNDNDDKIRGIIKDFSGNKANRITQITTLIEKAYKTGTLVYHFEEHNLKEGAFSKDVRSVQEKIINNTYHERLPMQLSEDIGVKILKEHTPSRLHSYFTGKEFEFFDSDGNFVGERLRVVERVVSQISTILVDGEELESRFKAPPFNYSYGTILTVLAVLMRAGRLCVKYNGRTIYNYRDEGILDPFSKSREFKKASFKAITSCLTLSQKREIVDHLKEIKAGSFLKRDFGYSTNDIELVSIIGGLSGLFLQRIEERRRMIPEFDTYFLEAHADCETLKPYGVTITDSNYKAKAEEFLAGYRQFQNAVNALHTIFEFIDKKLSTIKRYHGFVTSISTEMGKLDISRQETPIFVIQNSFNEKFSESVVRNYHDLEALFQRIKDEYYKIMEVEHGNMSQKFRGLKESAEKIKKEAIDASDSLNKGLITEVEEIIHYAQKHICDTLKIGYETSCQSCHFSLNEIITANQTIMLKETLLERIRIKIKYPEQVKEGRKPSPKRVTIKSERGEYTVSRYKKMLNEKLDQIRPLDEEDIIVVE